MERTEESFSSEDNCNDEDQQKLHQTISSLLENSLAGSPRREAESQSLPISGAELNTELNTDVAVSLEEVTVGEKQVQIEDDIVHSLEGMSSPLNENERANVINEEVTVTPRKDDECDQVSESLCEQSSISHSGSPNKDSPVKHIEKSMQSLQDAENLGGDEQNNPEFSAITSSDKNASPDEKTSFNGDISEGKTSINGEISQRKTSVHGEISEGNTSIDETNLVSDLTSVDEDTPAFERTSAKVNICNNKNTFDRENSTDQKNTTNEDNSSTRTCHANEGNSIRTANTMDGKKHVDIRNSSGEMMCSVKTMTTDQRTSCNGKSSSERMTSNDRKESPSSETSIAKNISSKKKVSLKRPAGRISNKVRNAVITINSRRNPSPRKKQGRASLKKINYSEIDEEDTSAQGETSKVTESLKENEEKGKKVIKERKVFKKVPRPAMRTGPPTLNPDEVSFFLPENWYFYATQRQESRDYKPGSFDMYYWTPPPRVKVRSRQELLRYLSKKHLDYDPLKFFRRQEIPVLLEKGVLKYFDHRTVSVATLDESVMNELRTQRKHVKTEEESSSKTLPAPFRSKRSYLSNEILPSTKSKILSTPAKSRHISSGGPENRNDLKTEMGRKFLKDSKGEMGRRNLKDMKADGLGRNMKDVKSEMGKQNIITNSETEVGRQKSKDVKLERLSPCGKSAVLHSETDGRMTRALKRETLSPSIASRKSSEESKSTEDSKETKNMTLPKKRGRPKKNPCPIEPESALSPTQNPSSIAEPPPSPPQSDSTLEGRARVRGKAPTKSPYFCSKPQDPKPATFFRKERAVHDPPPRSPYNLIQEDLFHDPWQLLIATIFLNSTSGRLAIPLALEFLKRWPTPDLARQAKIDDILDIIEPLGFGRTRAAIILRFSHEYLTKDWKLPIELYGIGEYGNDSYKIFCLKDAWKKVESDDPMLMMYLNWRRATEHIRKRFLQDPVNSDSVDTEHNLSKTSDLMSLTLPLKRSDRSPLRQQSEPRRKRRRTRTK